MHAAVLRDRRAILLVFAFAMLALLCVHAVTARATDVAPASLSGVVTAKATGEPVAGVSVNLYLRDADSGEWEWVGGADTGLDGSYLVTDLAPGRYKVGFQDPDERFAPRYYRGVTTLAAAEIITLGPGASVGGINAALVKPSHITGMVTDKDTGDPVEDVSVGIYRADGLLDNETYTDGSGYYSIDGLAAGSYKVAFVDASGYYGVRFWHGKTTPGSATAVTVGAAATVPDINAALSISSCIRGRVTDAGEDGIEDVCVTALYPDSSVVPLEAMTDASGYYALDGLAPGSYRVVFEDLSGYWATQYWDHTPFKRSARSVVLASESTVSDIDAVLGEFDELPPITFDDAPTEWQTEPLSVTLTAADDAAGVLATYYRVNGGVKQVYEAPIEISSSGLTRIEYWSVDYAGNVEDAKYASVVYFPEPADNTPSKPSVPPVVKHGSSFEAFGAIVKHDAGADAATLQFYHRQSGRWVLRRSVAAQASDVLTFSKYGKTLALSVTGKWRVRARHKVGSATYYSAWRNFVVE